MKKCIRVKFYNLISFSGNIGKLYVVRFVSWKEKDINIIGLHKDNPGDIMWNHVIKGNFILNRIHYNIAKDIFENPKLAIIYLKAFNNTAYYFKYIIRYVLANVDKKYEIVSDCEYTMKEESNNLYIL